MSRLVKRAVLRRAAGKSVWGQAILAELEEIDDLVGRVIVTL